MVFFYPWKLGKIKVIISEQNRMEGEKKTATSSRNFKGLFFFDDIYLIDVIIL
jgi:hypothetical protein